MTLLEPAVALTDYIVFLECAVFCVLMLRLPESAMRTSFILMFAGIGIAAVAGGTAHGFFPHEEGGYGRPLWAVTLAGIGAMALSGWRIGADLLFKKKAALWIKRVALLEFIAYFVYLLPESRPFVTAIINYAPAMLFLMTAFFLHYRKTKARPVLLGGLSLIMTFASSAMQQAKIGLHPVYFDHNVLYHVIQFAVIIMLFMAGRHLSRDGG